MQRKNELQQKATSRKPQQTKAYTKDTHSYATALLANHSRLPSLDIEQRLRYVSLTCPWMSVVQFDREKSGPLSTIHTVVHFKTCGTFTLRLEIEPLGETVEALSISPQPPLLLDETPLVESLIDKSLSDLDVSFFIYGLNSLLRLRHKRKRVWMSVLKDLPLSSVRSINSFPVKENMSLLSLNALLFQHSPAYVEFVLHSGSTLSIYWNLTFAKDTPHCLSDFHVLSTHSRNITQLFKSLVAANDVKIATLQILNVI